METTLLGEGWGMLRPEKGMNSSEGGLEFRLGKRDNGLE